MIAHYINRGHSLDELVNLTPLECQFFLCAWELEEERKAEEWEAMLGAK